MASIFSTATLGLKVDVKQFNKAMEGTGFATNDILKGMALSAANFEAKLDSATAGIKDTKRIISGILVSRGFYSLLEGLTTGATAALTFAANMETAAVSMEYFMEGANRADKAIAFIETMKDFSARTPFTTEQALSMSQYIQSMGISTKVVKSYLTTVTDAAAATGASVENLQRITLALGQMKTKGRLANEEIRQLANANIPIYEILQEELRLTGAEIASIGKKWVSSDKAIVAILTGLEKRYAGASQRISETMSGMLDTIVDDMKIISTGAGNFIYEGLESGVTKVRDLLEEYRATLNQFGAAGLVKKVLLDIDPTGEFARQVLTTIGNIKHLGTELFSLYTAVKPLIGLFGQSLYSAFNVATVVLTSFSNVVTGVIEALDKMGITTGTVADTIAQLYIAYTAAKWMTTLGEGAFYAAASVYQTVASIWQIFPAALSAHTGLISLAAGLAGVVVAGAAVIAMIGNLSNFAGLEVGIGSTVSTEYDAAMAEYEKQMEEYYAQLEKSKEDFNSPFSDIDDEASDAEDAIKDVADASKKAAKDSKKEWLASFDEVFAIPKDAEEEIKKELEFPDLTASILPPKFKFPKINVPALTMPELNTEDIWKDTTVDPDVFSKILPGLIAAGTVGLVSALAALRKTLAAAGPGSFGSPDIKIPDPFKPPSPDFVKAPSPDAFNRIYDTTEKINRLIEEYRQRLETTERLLIETTEEVKRLKSADTERLGGARNPELEAKTRLLEARIEELKQLIEARNRIADLSGTPRVTSAALPEAIEAARTAVLESINKKITQISADISRMKALPATRANELEALIVERQALLDERRRITGGSATSADIAGRTQAELERLFEPLSNKLIDIFENAFGDPYVPGNLLNYFNVDATEEAFKAFDEFMLIGDKLADFGYFTSLDIPTTVQRLYLRLKTSEKEIRTAFKTLIGSADSLGERIKMLDTSLKDLEGLKAFPVELREAFADLLTQADKGEYILRSLNKQLDVYYIGRAESRDALRRARADAAKRHAKKISEQTATSTPAPKPEPAPAPKEPLPSAAAKPSEEIKIAAESLAVEREIAANTETTSGLLADLKTIYAHYDSATTPDQLKAAEADIYSTVEELKQIGYDTNSLIADIGEEAASEIKAVHEELSLANVQIPQIIEEQSQKVIASVADAKKTIQEVLQEGVEETAAVTTQAKAVQQAIEAGFDNVDYYLTGTKASTAIRGVNDYGKDIPALAADVHSINKSMSKVAAIATDIRVQVAAANGTQLENYVRRVAIDSIDPKIAKIFAGDYKGLPGSPIVTQIDTVMGLMQDGAQDFVMLSNDIKTKTGKAFDALLKGSTEYANGIRLLPAEILRQVASEHFYQLALQGYTMSGGQTADTLVGMSAFNRDFDFTGVDDALVQRWREALAGTPLPKDIGGRIFSDKVILAWGEAVGISGAEAMTESYYKNVIEKIFTHLYGVDLSPLKNAFQQYIIDYPAAIIESLHFDDLAKQYYTYNKLLSTVMHSDNIGKFIKTYIAFDTSLGEQVVGLNFANKLRYMPSLQASIETWFKNVSRITGKAYDYKQAAAVLSANVRGIVDNILKTYVAELDAAETNIDAANIVAKAQEDLAAFVGKITSFLEEWPDPSKELYTLFGRRIKALDASIDYSGLSELAEALTDISKNLGAFEGLPRVLNAAIEGINSINDAIGTASVDNIVALIGKEGALQAGTVFGIANNLTRTLQLLGTTTDKVALSTIRQLETVHSIVKGFAETIKEGGQITAEAISYLEKVIQPFRPLGIGETIPYAAGDISKGLITQEITLSADAEGTFTDIINAAGTKQTTEIVGALREIVPASHYFDIEATGLPTVVEGKWEFPDVIQVSWIEAKTHELVTEFANYGEAQNAKNLAAYEKIFGTTNGITLENLNNGKDIKAIFTRLADDVNKIGGTLGGWNASNAERLGGSYDKKLFENIMGDDIVKWATDAREIFMETLRELTGKQISMPLEAAIQLLPTALTEGLHTAAVDVANTLELTELTLSGGLNGIVDAAKAAGDLTAKGLVGASQAIKDAAKAANIGEALGDVAKSIDIGAEQIADAAKAVNLSDVFKDIFGDKGGYIDIDWFANAFKDAADRAGTIWNTTKRKISRTLNDVETTLKGIKLLDEDTLIKQFLDMDVAKQAVKALETQFSELYDQLEVATRLPGNLELPDIQKAYDDVVEALKGAKEDYGKSLDAFYKTFIDMSADAAKTYDSGITNIFDVLYRDLSDQVQTDAGLAAEKTAKAAKEAISEAAEKATKETAEEVADAARHYVAVMLDPTTGTIGSVTEKLFAPITEIQKAIRDQIDAIIKEALPDKLGKVIADLKKIHFDKVPVDDLSTLSKNVYEALDELTKFFNDGTQKFDDLSKMAQQLYTAIDSTTGVKSIPKTLEELTAVLQKVLPSSADEMAAVMAEVTQYYKGISNIEDLSDAAKAAVKAVQEASDNLLILDTAAKKMAFIGEKISSTVSDTSKVLATSYDSIAKKIFSDIAGISIFDVLATVITGVLQAVADDAKKSDLQTALLSDSSTGDLAKILEERGISLGEEIGDYFSGVGEQVAAAAVNNIISSVAGWAAGKGIAAAVASNATLASAAGPAGTIAGVVLTVVSSIIMDKVFEGIGGKSDVYNYLSDYVKNRDDLIEKATQLGVDAGKDLAEAMADAQEAALVALRDYGYSSGSFLEQLKTDKLLYDKDTMGIIGDFVRSFTADANTGKPYDQEAADTRTFAGKLTAVLDSFIDGTKLENSSLATIGDYVELLYEHGVVNSDTSQEILAAVSENTELQSKVAELYPKQTQALELLDDYLAEYNKINNTSVDIEEAEQSGLMKEILAYIIKLYDATEAQKAAILGVDSEYETNNRKVTEGDVSTVVYGIDPDEFKLVTQGVLDSLKDFGIEISTGTADWTSELTGNVSESFATIKYSADKLKEHLAGWTIDTSDMEFNLGKATLSAKDIEVLGSVGIQINGDSTVTFMKAINEGMTGAERDLKLNAEDFTAPILEQLSEASIELNFDTSKINIDTAALSEQLAGASFKLPDDIEASLNTQMTAIIESIGDIMDSGYLMITEESVLNGEKSIMGYLSGLSSKSTELREAYREALDPEGILSDADFEKQFSEAFSDFDIEKLLSTKVTDGLAAIDELINTGTGTITENIVEWANSIVIPSPIREDQLTDDMRKAFEAASVTFEQYGEQFLMIINETGEHISDGITLVDKEKWEAVYKEYGEAFDELGVVVTDRGNQVAVDLSNTIDKGIDDVVALFINQPEVWGQIPEALKEWIGKANLTAQEEMLVLKTYISGGITDIGDGWVKAWATLSDETLAWQGKTIDDTAMSLEELSKTVKDGILKVEEITEDTDLDKITNDKIVVPFDDLPGELKEALLSVNSELAGKKVILSNTTADVMEGMVAALQKGKDDATSVAGDMADSIAKAITDALTNISRLENLQARAGTSGWFGSYQNQVSSQGIDYANGYTYYPEYNNKGDIASYWYYDSKGVAQSVKKLPSVPHRAAGGMASGLTLTGELGRELAILPNGETTLLGANGKGELVDLPAGTRVLNNRDTEDVLRYTASGKPDISKLAEGNVTVTDQAKFDDYMNKINAVLKKMSLSVRTQLSTYQNNNVASADAGFSVLNSGEAVYKYTTGLGNGTLDLSDSVDDTFGDLNDLIRLYEQTTEADLVNWANAVVLPSPVKADQVTPEMQAAFNEIRATFNEYNSELSTLVSEANKLLVSNMEPETAKELLQAALIEMFDTVLEGTEESMAELKEVVQEGLDDIKELCLDYIDELGGILEEATQTGLEGISGYVDEFIASLGESLGVVDETIAAAGEPLTEQLDIYSEIFYNALATIVFYFIDFDTQLIDMFGLMTESISTHTAEVDAVLALFPDVFTTHFDSILSVYDTTNTELRTQHEQMKQTVDTGLQNIISGIQGKQGAMQSAVTSLFQAAVQAMQSAAGQMQNIGQQIVNNLSSMVSQAQSQISRLQSLASQARTLQAQVSSSGSASSYSSSVGGSSAASLYQASLFRAAGGMAEGLTMTGEKGRELAVLRDGRTALLGRMGPQLVDLPSGTRIINNKDTEEILGYTGRVPGVDKLAAGNYKIKTLFDLMGSRIGDGVTAAQERKLTYAYGNQNAVARGLYGKQNGADYDESIDDRIDRAVTRTMEAVLPALANRSSSDDARTLLYVGTLVADDKGIKELSKRMEIVQLKESKRGS